MVRLSRRDYTSGRFLCVYCVERPGVEREDVVPRGFFDLDDKGRRIHVPACRECNHNYSLDEEYLRMVFTMELRAGENPTARALWQSGKARRGANLNQRLLRSILQTRAPVRLRTPGGVELPGNYHSFTVDLVKVNRFIEKIVRGILFADTRDYLPSDYIVSAYLDNYFDLTQIDEQATSALLAQPLGRAGEDVLQYRFVRAFDDPMGTVWAMRFYEGLGIIAFTEPASGALPSVR